MYERLRKWRNSIITEIARVVRTGLSTNSFLSFPFFLSLFLFLFFPFCALANPLHALSFIQGDFRPQRKPAGYSTTENAGSDKDEPQCLKLPRRTSWEDKPADQEASILHPSQNVEQFFARMSCWIWQNKINEQRKQMKSVVDARSRRRRKWEKRKNCLQMRCRSVAWVDCHRLSGAHGDQFRPISQKQTVPERFHHF